MDNVGIVVESLDAAISFFVELGLELEGRAMIEGDWSGRVTGLRDQRVEIAMMRMPDGHGRIELSRFLTPPPVADHRNAPVNALGYLRVMFAVDDLDDTLARLREHGAQVVDEVVQYEDVYRLCYVRGPEGILIGLAERARLSRSLDAAARSSQPWRPPDTPDVRGRQRITFRSRSESRVVTTRAEATTSAASASARARRRRRERDRPAPRWPSAARSP